MATSSIKALIVEDSEDDAELIVRLIKKSGYSLYHKRIDTSNQMEEALNNKEWDIIISDYKMPNFSGIKALEILNQSGLDIPFILVSGAIDEGTAVEAMRKGAADYIMKNNLPRLIPAIEREIKECKIRANERKMISDLKESEEKFRSYVENAPEGIFIADEKGNYIDVNDAACETTGYSKEELLKMNLIDLIPYDNRENAANSFASVVERGKSSGETSFVKKGGEKRYWIVNAVKLSENKYLGFTKDITDRRLVEENLKESEEKLRLKLDSLFSPEADLGEEEIGNILDKEALQSLMDDFYNLTHMGIAIIDLKGKVLVKTGWQDICTKFHRVHPETLKNCIDSDLKLTKGLKSGEFRAYKCKNNMWDIVTPIIIGIKHVGNIFIGQFFYEDESIDLEFFKSQAERYKFNKKEYIEALQNVPIWSREKVQNLIIFYAKFSLLISNLSHSNLLLAKSIADYKLVQEQLITKNKELSDIIEFLPDATFIIDMNKRIIAWNRAMEQMTGIQKEEILGKDSSYGAVPFYGKQRPFLIDLIFEPESQISSKYDFVKRKGDALYVEVFTPALYNNKGAYVWAIASPLLDVDGNAVGAIESIRDITESKLAEKALVESEEKFRGYVENANDIIYTLTLDGVFTYASPNWTRILGHAINEVENHLVQSFVHPEDLPACLEFLDKTIKTGKNQAGIEYRVLHKNGTWRWHASNASPMRDATGKVVSFLGVARDITNRKQAEEKLKESEEKYRTLFEDSKNPIWTTSREGLILDANQATADLLGYSKDELIGLDVHSLYVDPSHRKIFQAEIEEIGFVKNFQSQWKTKDGRQLDLLFDFTLWKDNDGKIIGYRGIGEDVTFLYRSKKQLEENLEYFAHLVDHIRNPLAILSGFVQVQVENPETVERVQRQVDRIEEIIKQLDQGWMDTEDTRRFLKKYM